MSVRCFHIGQECGHLFMAGCYIPGGARASSGYFKSPFIPSASGGGPITSTIAAALTDHQDLFILTIGQWKFVMESWREEVTSARESVAFSFEMTGSKSSVRSPIGN